MPEQAPVKTYVGAKKPKAKPAPPKTKASKK
jgi:hypothetical protein